VLAVAAWPSVQRKSGKREEGTRRRGARGGQGNDYAKERRRRGRREDHFSSVAHTPREHRPGIGEKKKK